MTQITVQVEEVVRYPITHRFVRDGIYEGYDFNLCVSIPAASPLVTVNGKTYYVSMQIIVEAVIGAVTKPAVLED